MDFTLGMIDFGNDRRIILGMIEESFLYDLLAGQLCSLSLPGTYF